MVGSFVLTLHHFCHRERSEIALLDELHYILKGKVLDMGNEMLKYLTFCQRERSEC